MGIKLTKFGKGEKAIVRKINGDVGTERRLESLGIRVGKKITKISSHFWKGPVTVLVDKTKVAIGYQMAERIEVEPYIPEGSGKRILLMGNPNVGKSAIFSRLTGTQVTISNYPGTTVDISDGYVKLTDECMGIVTDVPGIYNLSPSSKAEEVAVDMLRKGDIVINVVDATNLERNLFLTLELRETGVPLIIALNMWDETRHRGVELDIEKLAAELDLPVMPTCALTGYGIKELVLKLDGLQKKGFPRLSNEQKWAEVGRIITVSQKLRHHHHTLLEVLEDVSTRPVTGLPIAAGVIFLSFSIIRFIGESLINYVSAPFFDKFWLPVVVKLSGYLGGGGFVHDIIIGKAVAGQISVSQSFGLLTMGLYVPIAEVLPYIMSFFLVLGILEDIGYLPRLATQADSLMHRIGLHGYAIVPMILGLGCNVSGALALRLLDSRREKFIAATLMAIAIPCMAQTAVIVGLVGERGGQYVALIFGILFVVLILKGLLLNKVMKGKSPEILWEIPPYRMPHLGSVLKKLWMRMIGFLKDAMPLVLLGIFVVDILYAIKVFDMLAWVFAPVVKGLWGLPKETIAAMLIGFLRKDVAVGMLGPLALSTKELVIACTILVIYFPCVATFMIMVKELGAKDMLKAAGLMVLTALTVGTFLNIVL